MLYKDKRIQQEIELQHDLNSFSCADKDQLTVTCLNCRMFMHASYMLIVVCEFMWSVQLKMALIIVTVSYINN